ncbi:helix-turn-helix domain-containing protein [Chitinophaga sp. SYP-B3965]|uniref:helix-turn-helix transcriptional regulator n=1 Tax=Chitinophaga sp. SYP-B3965 TaxID=2663120 RepID=UPI001299FD7E|nr:AraC family transcriptional regulator [Chitinophaga sp. SYP-B3965]MRG49011.1 helix-turn-helix domain-containing protein [Chitinophaga sp. SYP-B3965]
MNILIENPELEEIVIQSKVDHALRAHQISLATAQTITGHFGHILTQYIPFDDFTVWHHMLHIKNTVKLYACQSEDGLPIIFALKGSVLSVEKCHISEGQCLIATPNISEGKYIEPGEYEFLHVDIKAGYLTSLAEIFPALKQVNNPKVEYRAVIPVKALLRIHTLLKNETGEMTGKLIMDSTVKQILLYTIEELSKQRVNGVVLPLKEKQKLEAVRSFITNNLEGKLTIERLGKQFGIARTSLKENFRKLFHTTIHSYIIDRKIEMAKLLLEEGETITEIAERVGYPDTTNFVRVFKNQTGLTPATYREKKTRPN